MQHLAFIGLGAMGTPMASRLIGAGFHLTAYDIAAERVRAAEGLGAEGAGSPREAAASVEAVVLMVVDAAQLEEALFGEDGAARALAPGAAVVVMCTVGPQVVRGVAERLAERGVRVLDAPVSGGVARAERGELLIMAGGDAALFAELRPALDAMGTTVVRCGERPGDGQAVKLVNQLLCGVHIAAAGEAIAYAEALGLEPRFVWDTVRRGAAGSFMLDDRGERMLNGAFTPARSALDIFVKDMGLVLAAAEEAGYRAPLATAARALYEEGHARGLGREDDSGIVRLFRDAERG